MWIGQKVNQPFWKRWGSSTNPEYQCSSCYDCRPSPFRDRQPAHCQRFAYCRFPFAFWMPLLMPLQADKDQRALLYECIRGHIVTLRGCKTGSKVIWLLWVAPAYLFVICFVDPLGFSDRMVNDFSVLRQPFNLIFSVKRAYYGY